MERVLDVLGREALEVRKTPFGSVGLLHAGVDLRAWWIWKDREAIDPEWSVFSRDDILYVVSGELRLEFRDQEAAVTVRAGQSFVIPAGAYFRGYRWPRESDEPCLFVAVSPADVVDAKAPAEPGA